MPISNQTHDYDSRLETPYRNYLEIDNQELVEPPSFEQVIEEIEKQILSLDKNRYKKYMSDTISLLKNNKIDNYDEKNKINVVDLLPRTWRFVKLYDKSGIECFLEQLADITSSGPCSQGRVTRIFQFYEFHMALRTDDIYKKCLK
jgi:hypothetical protein